jgi:hypothetical protein
MFEFTVIASGLDPQADDYEARFWEAGCDDATISFQNGRTIVDFAREAESLPAALASGIADVRKAGARIERIEPDPLVSLSDMAERAGLSRSAMTNYAKGYRQSGFPAPTAKVSNGSPLWDWAEVATWLHDHGRLGAEAAMAAAVIRAANERLRARVLVAA